jgi:hypothetical protein
MIVGGNINGEIDKSLINFPRRKRKERGLAHHDGIHDQVLSGQRSKCIRCFSAFQVHSREFFGFWLVSFIGSIVIQGKREQTETCEYDQLEFIELDHDVRSQTT